MATNNAPVQGPQIEVPTDHTMATEPARTIGQLIADKTMIRPLIAAGVAIAAQVFRFAVDDQLVENITTIVTTVAVLYAAWAAQQEATARARQQADMTRDAVWSPASVADAVVDAANTGDAEIRPVTPPDWTDPATWPDPPMPEPIRGRRASGPIV